MKIEDQLQPNEEILYRAYVTRLTLGPWIALAVVALGIAAFLWFSLQNGMGALIALAVAVIALLIYAWKDFVRRANDYVLTNHRLIQEVGILSRRSLDSRLDKINNVEHRQTLWGRLFNYGDVEIDTASERGETLFRNLGGPLAFKNAILAAAEQYRSGNAAVRLAPAAPAGPSGAERLRQLKGLFDDGLLSKDEYEAKRQELMGQL
jgi:uncharacterized membrane protein YdbT with pleckstrin-like domain